jgi:hypothetical protein
MDGDKSITAVFVEVPTYTLSGSVSGSGSISPNSGTFSQGEVISITATPDAGWKFDNWSGDASGSDNPLSITMDSDKSISASFSEMTGVTLTLQENEDGFCSVDGSVDDDNSGFTGDGFANTDNASGEGITWSVNIPADGTYSLVWQYAHGKSEDRTAQLMQDGTTIVSNISMSPTGSWTTWTETASIDVNLTAGNKLLRLEATSSGGLANIDYMKITGDGISPVACLGLKSASLVKNTTNVNIYPNPANGMVSFEFENELTEKVTICLLDMTGKPVKTIQTSEVTYSMDISDLSDGVYFVRISGSNLNIVKTLTKE